MWWIIAIVAVVVLLVLWFIGVANKLVRKKAEVDNAFADIDVYLTKRFDLIPNLVNTIKGYTKHEKETFEAVVEARNKGLGAQTINEKVEADEQMSSALGRLLAISESYPELKADTSFIKLQESLNEIETELVGARRYFNATVKAYNILIHTIPSNIVAGILGYKDIKLYEASEEQRKNVTVDFSE
ncbi:MAG: LemA family protein [Bacilli bacterium]|jgi:LemA protein|nr:LemA family protein [Bacilli bacterium]